MSATTQLAEKTDHQIEDIILKIREKMPLIAEKYHIKTLQVFGSYVRGEQRKKSDMDILVEFNRIIDLFSFIELENYLSDILGIKVDLVMKDTLKSRIKESILQESIPV